MLDYSSKANNEGKRIMCCRMHRVNWPCFIHSKRLKLCSSMRYLSDESCHVWYCYIMSIGGNVEENMFNFV